MHRNDLLLLGVCLNKDEPLTNYNIEKAALLRYREIHGSMEVRGGFIVPRDSQLWPRDVWDVKLGRCRT